jgi:hypothetical protein
MTEVHHIDRWNGSNTTLPNAITLCRFHHMQLHANGWRILQHDDGQLIARSQTSDEVPLRPRSPFIENHQRT